MKRIELSKIIAKDVVKLINCGNNNNESPEMIEHITKNTINHYLKMLNVNENIDPYKLNL